jgi:protein TonB
MTFHDTATGAAMAQLWPALAVSIALHAVLLVGFPDVWTFTEPPIAARLNAWIEPGVTAAEPSPAAGAEAPKPKSAAAPRETPAQPVAAAPATNPQNEIRESSSLVAAPRVQEQPVGERTTVAAASPSGAAKSRPEAAAPRGAASGAGEGAPDLGSLAPDGGSLAPDGGSLAPDGGSLAPDGGSLAQYRLALIGAAKRHKLYPSHAIERGWQGRVDVRLVLGANGELAGALVQRSSGHDLLDRQALEMMRKAAALTPIPPALRNREFAVEVPVLFELKSES